MKIAIVGSRGYADEQEVRAFVRSLNEGDTVVSGGARGVDSWAEDEARKRGLEVKVFPADWDRLGRRAGFVRNADIVAYSEAVVAFWDGSSKGTASTIRLARQAGKSVEVRTPPSPSRLPL